MLNVLRKLLPNPVKSGFKKALGMPSTRMHPHWKIVEKTGVVGGAHTVLDIGARNGWFLQCWLDWQPDASIIAFDPEKEAYDALKERYKDDDRVRVESFGIAETRDKKIFYKYSDSPVSSSLLKPQQKTWDEIKYKTGELVESVIETITLDEYIDEHAITRIHMIKMDIQGYELLALKGAVNTLRKTDYLLVESAIKPLYQGAATFDAVHRFMDENDFHLMDIRSWHRGNNVLIETDLLYRRNGLEGKIDAESKMDREYTSI